MTLQIQRFVREAQTWRTVRMVESFLDAQVYMETMPWGAAVNEEQWNEFTYMGQWLGKALSVFQDVIVLVNEMGHIVVRTQRGMSDTRGYFYLCIRDMDVAVQCFGYTEVKGTFVFGSVPYQSILEVIKWVHAR